MLLAENVIGRGGCGDVYRATLADGSAVAVKSFHRGSEAAFYTAVRHPNIVQLLGYSVRRQPNRWLLAVYTFAPQGDLEQRLHGAAIPTLTEPHGFWVPPLPLFVRS